MGVAWKDLSWGQKKQIRQENRSTEIEGENRKRMGVPASMATNYLVVTASMATNDLVVYLCKMFRHFLAHQSNLMVVFKGALEYRSMEELQSIFEMLFADQVRQLQPLYLKMKDMHDEKAMISGSAITSYSLLETERKFVEKRIPSWSELLLTAEIEQLKKLGMEGTEECNEKMKKLECERKALDDSIYRYGLK